MAITVTMIEEKEFKTKVRGYDPVEVDEFLDAICDEMIDMQGTIQTLREQLKQKSEQVSSSYAPLPVSPLPQSVTEPAPAVARQEPQGLPQDILAAQKLLEKTQRSCSEVLADAKKRAEDLLKEAEDQLPDPELLDLQSEKDQLTEDIEKLKEEAAAFRKRFQSMLQDQNEMLETDLF